jgi:hypothetical protein
MEEIPMEDLDDHLTKYAKIKGHFTDEGVTNLVVEYMIKNEGLSDDEIDEVERVDLICELKKVWLIIVMDKNEVYRSLVLRPTKYKYTSEQLNIYNKLYMEWLVFIRTLDDSTLESFKYVIKKAMPEDVWKLKIQGDLLYNDSNFDGDKATVQVLVNTPGQPNATHVYVDVEDFQKVLCENKIDLNYLINCMTPDKKKSLLIVLSHDKHGGLTGVRVVHLDFNSHSYEAKGVFACSKGMGKVIQQVSENIIKKLRYRFDGHLAELVASHSPNKIRDLFPVEKAFSQGKLIMRFYAIPSAVGFWKRVGFKENGIVKNSETEKKPPYVYEMTKVLDASPQWSAAVGTPAPRPTRRRKTKRLIVTNTSSSSSSSSVKVTFKKKKQAHARMA